MGRDRVDAGMYRDHGAEARGEPGIWHSYMGALLGVLEHLQHPADPAWLMGVTGWAFRINVNEALCPSATSVFAWEAILPETVAQAGYEATQYHGAFDTAAQRQAHEMICTGLDRGVPAVVWDIGIPEWGLVTGYDTDSASYDTVDCLGQRGTMPRDDLGRREIEMLSVTVLGEPNGRAPADCAQRGLQLAVSHGRGREWMDRAHYQDGPAAYALWADLLDAGATHPEGVPSDYYLGHYYGARCYARDFLGALAGHDAALGPAAKAYATVAAPLAEVWAHYRRQDVPDRASLAACAGHLRTAQAAEQEGLALVEGYLAG